MKIQTTTESRSPYPAMPGCVPILERSAAYGAATVTIVSQYDGEVPSSVWHRLACKTRKLASAGYFYPLDTMDAYQHAVCVLEAKAADMPEPDNGSTEAYLAGVADRALLSFHSRKVRGERSVYRAACRTKASTAPSPAPDCETRRRMAAETIGDILAATADPAVTRAFHAYLAEDGNLAKTAERLGFELKYFYKCWRHWLAKARRAAVRAQITSNSLITGDNANTDKNNAVKAER